MRIPGTHMEFRGKKCLKPLFHSFIVAVGHYVRGGATSGFMYRYI